MPQAFLFGRYWRGDGPLWRVYWLYGVAGSALIMTLIAVPAFLGWLTPAILAGVVLAAAIYAQWLLVSVWRCAHNIRTDAFGVRRRTWGILARLLTLAWTIGAIGIAAILFHVLATRQRAEIRTILDRGRNEYAAASSTHSPTASEGSSCGPGPMLRGDPRPALGVRARMRM
jgi:hypothetical protein